MGMMTEWTKGNAKEQRSAEGDLGGTMRLGAYPAYSLPVARRIADIYGTTHITERHRHRYEVNMAYRKVLEANGLLFSGVSPDGTLPEIVERTDHPWFIGVQFHPELKSKPFEPHPLFARLYCGGDGRQSRKLVLRCQGHQSRAVLERTVDGWLSAAWPWSHSRSQR